MRNRRISVTDSQLSVHQRENSRSRTPEETCAEVHSSFICEKAWREGGNTCDKRSLVFKLEFIRDRNGVLLGEENLPLECVLQHWR